MRIRVVGALLALVVSTACQGSPAAVGVTSTATRGTASPRVGEAAGDRQAAVYRAVLRHYLTGADSSFGVGHRWPIVYVVDRAVRDAADPARVDKGTGGVAIPATVRTTLTEDLRDVAPLRFVASRQAALAPSAKGDSCQRVDHDGIVITLAPVAPRGDRVEVGVSGYVACLAATWLTYVVEQGNGRWRITGTTGPRAIS
jgi:hypothetical protein